jgi:hypothetical protein
VFALIVQEDFLLNVNALYIALVMKCMYIFRRSKSLIVIQDATSFCSVRSSLLQSIQKQAPILNAMLPVLLVLVSSGHSLIQISGHVLRDALTPSLARYLMMARPSPPSPPTTR